MVICLLFFFHFSNTPTKLSLSCDFLINMLSSQVIGKDRDFATTFPFNGVLEQHLLTYVGLVVSG